jgi:hypothetical protein
MSLEARSGNLGLPECELARSSLVLLLSVGGLKSPPPILAARSRREGAATLSHRPRAGHDRQSGRLTIASRRYDLLHRKRTPVSLSTDIAGVGILRCSVS